MTGMISFLVIMLLIAGLVIFWIYKQSKPPKYNGFLWPLGGGVVRILRRPEGQKPFRFTYRWYDVFPRKRPLYFWQEVKAERKLTNGVIVTETLIQHWEPDKPADYKILGDEGREYVTPYELFDNTDWECARQLEAPENKWADRIKTGSAVAMVAICVVALIMTLGMLGEDKEKQQQTVQAQQPVAMEIER